MARGLLLVLCVGVAFVSPISAQVFPCLYKWQTTDDTGAYWTPASGDGTRCSPGVPNQCRGGPNANCVYSLRTFSYRCCHDVWLIAGVQQAAAEGFSKPLCPYGAQSWFMGNQALTCKVPNSVNDCPYTYTCTKAVNLPPQPMKVGATAAVAPIPCNGDSACEAYLNPYACCLTSTLPGNMAKAFAAVGLTPSVVPTAPQGAIQDINIKVTAPAPAYEFPIHQGEDWSSQRALFTTVNTPDGTSTATNAAGAATAAAAGEIFLSGVSLSTAEAATAKFHVLMFDVTSNKDILMFNYDLTGVIGASGVAATDTAAEILEVPPRIKLTPTASVLSVTPLAGVQTLNTANYIGPASFDPKYTTKHQIAVLVFKTSDVLANLVPKLDLTATATGHFQPKSNPTSGKFTTVTALLNSPEGKALGAPVAGTYFYV